jgi:hypothetical protein
MLGKCVHSVSGIQTKQIVKVDHYAGFDFYMLRTDYENNNGFQRIYFEYDGHFFPIASNKERIKSYLDENPDFNILQWVTTDFEESLKEGVRINRGYAEYLGRTEEAKKAVEAYKVRKEQEQEEKRKQEEQKERQKALERQNKLIEAAEQYKQGEKIDGDIFLSLCELYNVSVAIRTKGWIKESLSSISCNNEGRVQYRYAGNDSTKIGDVARKLFEALKDNKEENENDTLSLDELNKLFGVTR